MDNRDWMDVDELAEELGVPVRTIYAWRVRGTGPRAAKFGRHLRFNRADVDDWVLNQLDDD